MIALVMIVIDELRNRLPEVTLTHRNHSIETLVLNRPHEPFGIGIRIRRLKGVCTTRIPASRSRARTGALHFASRSQIST